jgi:hypothetical protein
MQLLKLPFWPTSRRPLARAVLGFKQGVGTGHDVREIVALMAEERADLALLVTTSEPTAEASAVAWEAGYFQLPGKATCPRVQLFSMTQLRGSPGPQLPLGRLDIIPRKLGA